MKKHPLATPGGGGDKKGFSRNKKTKLSWQRRPRSSHYGISTDHFKIDRVAKPELWREDPVKYKYYISIHR